MEDIDSSPEVSSGRKRTAPNEDTPGKKPLNLKGTQFIMRTPPTSEECSSASSNGGIDHGREPSPSLSISTMTDIDMATFDTAAAGDSQTPSSTEAPPAKRRKLTPSEKLAKAQEREIKERERAEAKARKDEEKRVKDEEKRRKAEEREVKKREKELAEQAKDQAKQAKEEAKQKKERSQLRLGAFFNAGSATPNKSIPRGTTPNSAPSRNRSLSLERYDNVVDQMSRDASPSKHVIPQPTTEKIAAVAPVEPSISDYKKYFLPFEPPTNSSWAKAYTIINDDDLAYWQGEFDREINNPTFHEKVDLGLVEPTAAVDHMFKADRAVQRGVRVPNTRTLIERIQGTSTRPIDLTEDWPMTQPLELLNEISVRHIQFDEDVRPAYCGTYTKIKSPRSVRKLMLNPFGRERKDTNYDYDSEAEWEEPEEGDEDCGEDEEDCESVGDADEMDGFLDDEEDALKNKHRMITGDLQASSTGIWWENASHVMVRCIDGEEVSSTPEQMQDTQISFLLPQLTGHTIDPFSTAYWAHEMAPPDVPITKSLASSTSAQRKPLQERPSNSPLNSQINLIGAAEGEKGPINIVVAAEVSQIKKRGLKPQPKILSKADLDEFKDAVVGSKIGKVELNKALKLRFPKLTIQAIKDTLDSQFAYLGAKGEKEWKFVG